MANISSLLSKQNFFIDLLIDTLLVQKFTNIKVMKLEKDNYHDYMIVCTSNSLTQMGAVIKKIKTQFTNQKLMHEGLNSSWLLITINGILIQIFTQESREYYNIESIYFDSEIIHHYA